jgi:hypothetical protein
VPLRLLCPAPTIAVEAGANEFPAVSGRWRIRSDPPRSSAIRDPPSSFSVFKNEDVQSLNFMQKTDVQSCSS